MTIVIIFAAAAAGFGAIIPNARPRQDKEDLIEMVEEIREEDEELEEFELKEQS